MKNYALILLLSAMTVACRNNSTWNLAETADEENDKFIEYADSLEVAAQESFSVERSLTWGFVDFGKTYNYDEILKTPPSLRQNITDIDMELSILFDDHCYWRYSQWDDEYQPRETIRDRLLFYLKHPATFTEDMPLLSSKINIVTTDDGLYKFYSWKESQGTSNYTSYLNYIQYRDSSGKTVWVPYGNDWLENTEGVEDVWQIEVKGKTFYVVKLGNDNSKDMEIISIDPTKYKKYEITPWGHSNVIVYHPEFFPKTKFRKEYTVVCDDKGKCIENGERTDFSVSICTNSGERYIKSDYTFDPKTYSIITFTTNSEKRDYVHIGRDQLRISK